MIGVIIYLVSICIVCFLIVKLKRRKMTTAKCVLLSWILATVVFLPLYWILPDYIAPRYPTAEEAFLNSGKGKIITTAEGEQSAFVVYRQFSGAFSTAILPKDDKGYWNSTHIFFQKRKNSIVTESGGRIYSVQFRNTSDLYLWGTGLDPSTPCLLSDNQSIKLIEVPDGAYKSYLFCMFISNAPETLSITINGKSYSLF